MPSAAELKEEFKYYMFFFYYSNSKLKNNRDGADFYVFNAGDFLAPSHKMIEGVDPKSKVCVAMNFTERKLVILGTQYAGEMKKGIFTIMHFLMPKKGVLSLHSSANLGKDGDVTLLFGLSCTGKTTLSADPHR